VKTNAPAAAPLDSADISRTAPSGLRGAWLRFWFTPTDPLGLHCMRVLAGLVFLWWLLPLTGAREALFGMNGLFDATAYREASRLPGGAMVPQWSLLYVFGHSDTLLSLFWWSSIAVLALFTLGVATRVTGVLTWFVVVSFLASPAAQPDSDQILALPAFYLMLGYLLLGQWNRPLSVLERIFGPRGTSVFSALRPGDGEPVPSYAANFALRLFQVHFAIVVVTSALHKLQIDHWWSGVAYWFPMHAPLAMDALKIQGERGSAGATLIVLSLAAYMTLAWQLAFPWFAFRRRLRVLLLAGAAVGMIGLFLLWGEWTYAPLFAVCCLSYVSGEEWRRLSNLVFRPLQRQASGIPAPKRPSEKTTHVKATMR
jgi:hypothetical protein